MQNQPALDEKVMPAVNEAAVMEFSPQIISLL
jgi:hypothetical protein